jgi:hypothetical protein
LARGGGRVFKLAKLRQEIFLKLYSVVWHVAKFWLSLLLYNGYTTYPTKLAKLNKNSGSGSSLYQDFRYYSAFSCEIVLRNIPSFSKHQRKYFVHMISSSIPESYFQMLSANAI